MKPSSTDHWLFVILYLYRFFLLLFHPTVYRQSSIWNTIVLKLPTVGKSSCLTIYWLFVLNMKLAWVRFWRSKPPKIRILEGSIW